MDHQLHAKKKKKRSTKKHLLAGSYGLPHKRQKATDQTVTELEEEKAQPSSTPAQSRAMKKQNITHHPSEDQCNTVASKDSINNDLDPQHSAEDDQDLKLRGMPFNGSSADDDDDDDEFEVEVSEIIRLVKRKTEDSVKVSPSLSAMGESHDCKERAKKMFQFLIYPLDEETFFSKYWEKQPLLIRRRDSSYYDGWFSSKAVEEHLSKGTLRYGLEIDVANFIDGVRTTLNIGNEKASRPTVWKRFVQEGASIRILHPQTFHEPMYKMCSVLQDYFSCVVGSNVYLTPAGNPLRGSSDFPADQQPWLSLLSEEQKKTFSKAFKTSDQDSSSTKGNQGFAPHYDDVDVFILQLEGRKHWELFRPLPEEELPRYPSENLDRSELGDPFRTLMLEQGDLLYFPRGVIHQAFTDNHHHSMHLTLSTMQRWTMRDYLERVLLAALEKAFEEDIQFRKAVPLHLFDMMGAVNSSNEDPRREDFSASTTRLFLKLKDHLPMDAAADQMAVEFLHGSLPPYLPQSFRASALQQGLQHEKQPQDGTKKRKKPSKRQGQDTNGDSSTPSITLMTMVRLVSSNAARIVVGEDVVMLYFNTRNSRSYMEVPKQYLEFPPEAGPCLEYLLDSYPDWVPVRAFPDLEFPEDQLEVAKVLFEVGLLQVNALTPV